MTSDIKHNITSFYITALVPECFKTWSLTKLDKSTIIIRMINLLVTRVYNGAVLQGLMSQQFCLNLFPIKLCEPIYQPAPNF